MPQASTSEVIEKLRSFAYEIYSDLGAGHAEPIYHQALLVCLRAEGFHYEHEKEVEVTFRERFVGIGNADIVIACSDGNLIVEIKVSKTITDGHKA